MPRWDEHGNQIDDAPAQSPNAQPRRRRRWDAQGREITDEPRGSTFEDVVRSFGTGVERGISGLATIPQAVASANDATINWAADRVSDLAETMGRDVTPQTRQQFRRSANEMSRPLLNAVSPLGAIGDMLPSAERVDQAIDDVIPGERHEPQTTAGEYSRTVGEFAPGLAFPGGATRTVLGQVGSRIATNVVAPALASEAAGQATEGTGYEPWARLGGAVAGGVGASTVQRLGTRGGMTPADRAVRMIDRRLGQGDTSIDELDQTARALRRQGGDTGETIAEVGGKPLQRAARAVANVDGEGQGIASAYLDARNEGVTGRLLSEVTRATAPQQTRAPRNFYDARETLRTARAGQGAEAYRAAHAQEIDQAVVNAELLPLMQRGPTGAIKSGIAQLESAGLRAQSELALARSAKDAQAIQRATQDLAAIDESIGQLRAVGEGSMPNRMNVRALDYYQRGLGQMADSAGYRSPEGAAMEQARQTFNRYLDEVAPAFGQARSNYGASIRIEELMQEGRRVFNMPDGEIELLLRGRSGRGLTTEEFDGFMLGVMDALETKIKAGDTAFVARFMRNQNWQSQLERAFTPSPDAARRALEAARRRSGSQAPIKPADIQRQQQRMARQATQRLRNRIAREASMRRFDNAVRSGSQTTPMAEDIKALTQGESELGFLSEIIQGGGNVRGPALKALARAWDRFNRPGIYNPQVNRELAQRLFQPATTGNVRELRREIAALRRRGVTIEAPLERDLVRAAVLVRDGGRNEDARQNAASAPSLEQRAAAFSDEDLERIAAGAN